jgi:hypothetical protein
MTQAMAAGRGRTWRIPLAGNAQADPAALLDGFLRLARIECGAKVFHISTCPDMAPGIIKRRGCALCRLDSPAEFEAEAIKIVEEKETIGSLKGESAEEAVALIVAVDANSSKLSSNEVTHLGRDLRRLAQARQDGVEPSGFPVFIVLTHVGTIDQIAVNAGVRTRLLDDSGLATDSSARFLDVRIEVEPRPGGGKDTAELFSGCLSAALDYGQSMERARQRLARTTASATAALVMMVLLAVTLGIRSEPSAISLELNALKLLAANRPGWLHEPYEAKLERLTSVENDPAFRTLSRLDQAFIRETGEELRNYQRYRSRLLDVDLNRPRSKGALVALRAELTSGWLAVPAHYRELWQHTNAYDYHELLLTDLRALQNATDQGVAWYENETSNLNRLYAFSAGRPESQNDWTLWLRQSADALAAHWPHSPGDSLPGAVMLTYVAVTQSPGVEQAHRQWVLDRNRLEQLRMLVLVLGLGGPLPNVKQPPLAIGSGFRAEESGACLEELRRLTPDLEQGPSPALPEAIVGDLRHALAEDYRNLIVAGRSVIEQQFLKVNGGENTLAAWQKLLPYLGQPDDLRAWRTLTGIVQRLRGTPPVDPINALAIFLKRDHFELDPHEAELRVPLSSATIPSGPLVIDLDGPNTQWVFASLREPVRDNARDIRRYRFKRAQGNLVRFVPGDRIRASLPVRRSGKPGSWSMLWDRPLNSTWAFDALARTPRWLDSNGSAGDNDPALSSQLILLPAASWPSVPDLLPAAAPDRPRHLP